LKQNASFPFAGNLTQRTLVLARILIAKPVSTFAEHALALPLVEHGCAVAACGLLGASIGTCMTTQRRSYETGHKPKCLVIVDDSAEWDRAVYYASRWAIRVDGGVVMLRIIETEDQNQQWLGVADIMRAEAHEDANAALDRAAGRANGIAAITPEKVIREGDPTDQILDVIDKDVDIAKLVLAANPGPEGPGPIITTMAKTVGSFPIPVTIVPGDLSDEEIDALS
jgi:nucleotide-binding universal stress UspA family protein